MRVVYMGTPGFAVRPLAMLVTGGVDVALAVTAPDKRQGRGKKLAAPPVKEEALRLGIPVQQPESVRTPEFLGALGEMEADFLVVAAYGRILPRAVLEAPRIMAVNIHPSLLPRYRGPAPLNWAIMNGDRETGVTIMAMDSGVDTGGIVLQEKAEIYPKDTAESLGGRLSEAGGRLLLEAMEGLLRGKLSPRPQEGEPSFAPLLRKDDGRIRWERPALDIERQVRAMHPWPGAFTFWGDRRIKVLAAETGPEGPSAPPGTVLPSPPQTLLLAAGSGTLYLTRLQGSSGKAMNAAEYLRGNPVPAGLVFH